MGFRVVRPEVDVLPLSNGKTITVKRRLNTGEERALLKRSRAVDGSHDQFEYAFQAVVAYLLDWSAPDASPAIKDVDEATLIATLNSIEANDFLEIQEAINKHRAAYVAARADEKKTTLTGELDSSAISTSAA